MIDIKFKNIQIDSMSGNTGVFLGKNYIVNWSAHLKSNYNYNINNDIASLFGNDVSNSINILEDKDHMDYVVPTSQSPVKLG